MTAASKADFKFNDIKICLCKEKHHFWKCSYIVKSIRSSDWKSDSAIQKLVEKKLKNVSARLKEIIKFVWKQIKKKKKKKKSTEFITDTENFSFITVKNAFFIHVFTTFNQTDYHFWDSFIMNSKVNAHVFNQWDQFYNLISVRSSNCVYISNEIISIKDFESVDIIVKALKDICQIILLNIALILSLHISIVSLCKFKIKKIYFDSKNDWIVMNSKTFCYLEDHHEQWIFEYNKSSNTTVFALIKNATQNLTKNSAENSAKNMMKISIKIFEALIDLFNVLSTTNKKQQNQLFEKSASFTDIEIFTVI